MMTDTSTNTDIGPMRLTYQEAVAEAVTYASSGAGLVWYMGASEISARQFIDDCAGALSPVQPYWITFPSGCSVHAMPWRPERLRGKKGLAICGDAERQDEWIKATGGLVLWGGRRVIVSGEVTVPS